MKIMKFIIKVVIKEYGKEIEILHAKFQCSGDALQYLYFMKNDKRIFRLYENKKFISQSRFE